MQHRRHFLHTLGSAAVLGSLSPLSALAQGLDQVKIMYGFPAGSAGDSVARRVAEKLGGTPYSKNPGFVENKPGAGGRIAVETLKNSPADGSVLTLAPVSALAVYPYIYPKLAYKPEDVAPVSIGAIMFHGLAVGPSVPAEVKTLKDFLAWAKANPAQARCRTCWARCSACARAWSSSTCPTAAPCPASPTWWAARSPRP